MPCSLKGRCAYEDQSGDSSQCKPCLDAFCRDGTEPNWTPAKVPSPTGLPDQQALPENPKAIYGRAKPSLSLIPSGAALRISEVFKLGATKYGPFNWRKDAVSASTYMDAAQRHMLQWFDGEDTDPESGQLHLAHAAACMMILIDAESVGKLIDDRPIKGKASDLIAALTTTTPSI